MPLKIFEPLQKALADRFNGDPAVCDLSRVMRLAGFVHRKEKDKPFLSHIVAISSAEPHRALVLLKAFRPPKEIKQDRPQQRKKLNTEAIRRYADWVPDIFARADKTSAGGYRVTSVELGRDNEEDLSFHPDG